MNSQNEKNVKIENDINNDEENKSKSVKRIGDEIKSKNNKKERSYRVGNYLIKNTLGSGTFGKVKLGIYLPTKEKVAVKILEKSKMTEKDDLIRLEREFEMLAQFNHPNLIMVTEIFESDNNYYTVMDYCEGGELFNYIVKNKYLSEKESSFFYYQIISGLEYIHSLGIVHRDLKPENLLLTKDHILKIIDFGLSNYFKEGQNTLLYTPCGSPCYASPEMVTGNNYDGVMIDIWSTGIILFAMLCGYLPFEDKNNEKLFKKIAECKIEYPTYLSDIAIDLLKKIIVPDPKKRITINEIKKHPFYIKGKQLFDQEFTIQYLNDENNSEKNENNEKIDKNNKKDDIIINKKSNDIKDNNIIEKKEKKNENMQIKNNPNNDKENYNNNNYNNINNNYNKNIFDNNKIIDLNNENINYKSIINNDNFILNIDNNFKSNNFQNNINNIYEESIIYNNENIQKQLIDLFNEKKNINKKDTNNTSKENKNIKNNDNNFNNSNNYLDNKNHKNFIEENLKLIKNSNKERSEINIDKENSNNRSNINMEEFVKSLNIINLKQINNNTIEASINFSNLNNNNEIKNRNKKNIKISNDKNYLIIEDLNNSVDNKKLRNNNDILNNCQNHNSNITKENNKKANDYNSNYCSNTYNIKKNKNKLKGNKLINTVLGKILKINVIEKSKEKKERLNEKDNKEKIKIIDNTRKKREEDFNPKILSTRNTYDEKESKFFEKHKIYSKSKEKKNKNNTKNNQYINPKPNYFILDSYNYHKFAMSTDIKNIHTQIDKHTKSNNTKNNDNINVIDNSKGNKSVRQDCYPTAMKKLGGTKKLFTTNLKFNSNSINKNISYNNKLNNEFKDYTLKTETNEILLTDIGNINLDKNTKHKNKKNKNLFEIESKPVNKDTNKPIKNSLYKKQNTGIYSSNNLNNFKTNNGNIFKNVGQNILNENRLTSNRKRNFKTKFKFNNLSNINIINNSENKTKKFNKIFIQKKIDKKNLTNIASSYSSKINNNFKSNFVNYNNNINSSKERKNIYSKNKSLKNEKLLNFSNKNPAYYMEDGISLIDYEIKNNNNINKNINQQIKNNNNNLLKSVRQIKKNINYIHIKKNKIKPGNKQRNKSKSITKNKEKQKSISTEEPFNLKEYKNINDILKNPFNQINKALILNNKRNINNNKINLKKNNLYEVNNTNPLVNIRNTFISFNMYPKYYLDPKKQLSSPKIIATSPKKINHSKKKINSNMKIISNKKYISLANKNHLRQNTSPSLESPSKKFEIKNLINMQQNIFKSENQKLFYYVNTEYEQNIPNNMNIDTIQNMKSKLLNKKYKTICKDISYNNKIKNWNNNNNINQNLNLNLNNKNLSNTISPTNEKKYNHKIYLKSTNNKNHLKFNKINTNNIKNIHDNFKKNRNCLINYVINTENDSNIKKGEIEIIDNSNKFNFKKK